MVALAGALGHVDGGIGLLHQDKVILVVIAEQADPHGGATVQLVIADVEGARKIPIGSRAKCSARILAVMALAQCREEQGKFVPEVRASTRFSWGRDLSRTTTAWSSRSPAGVTRSR